MSNMQASAMDRSQNAIEVTDPDQFAEIMHIHTIISAEHQRVPRFELTKHSEPAQKFAQSEI
jgi:hypothetical protein